MKTLRTLLLSAASAALFAAPAAAQTAADCWLRGATPEAAADRPSPLGVTTFTVGGETGWLCYGRPAANGRTVMGELVPFGSPWRTGANEATTIHLPFAAEINGVELAPGKYTIYTTPGETEWTFHFSTAVERWGIPISAEVQEAVVGSVTRTVAATDEPVEMFTVRWETHGGMMGHLVFEWENTRVELGVHHADMEHGEG